MIVAPEYSVGLYLWDNSRIGGEIKSIFQARDREKSLAKMKEAIKKASEPKAVLKLGKR